ANVEHAPGGADLAVLRGPGDGLHRDVLKLKSENIHTLGERPDGSLVIVCSGDFEIAELPGRRVVSRAETVHAVAHPPGGDGEHAAELAAAHDADGAARKKNARF